jgi:spermidine synthase
MFKELDFRKTPLGEISLRMRGEPRLDGKILYEVKLGEEFLMSSLFTEAEIQLAKLGLALLDNTELDVVVGGLGLGYTAAAVLENPAVQSLVVIDIMQAVIDWHQQGLVPLGEQLTSDNRCKLIQDDFFQLAGSASNSFDSTRPDQKVHAVLLDIDHSPRHWLNSENASFYTHRELEHLALKLHPGGVFGLWSNDPPDEPFMQLLGDIFAHVEHHVVVFDNPYTRSKSNNTVYLAQTAGS